MKTRLKISKSQWEKIGRKAGWIRVAAHRETWIYKGHELEIEEDIEEDNIKMFHSVITPSGERLYPNLDPYDRSRKILELWIDAGYPKSPEEDSYVRALSQSDLMEIIEKKEELSKIPVDKLKDEDFEWEPQRT